jgi:hypothetical protein
LKELQEDRLELLIRSASNPFVPNEIAGMRRDIKLLRSQDPGASGQERIKCRYRFRDTAIVSRNPSEHDLIVVGSQLYRIDKKSNGNELEIEFLGKGSPTEAALWDGKNYADAIHFSRIDPLKYYLEMLGLYLQQLVLTYSPITTTTRDRVDIHALLRAFEIGPPFHILTLKSQSDNELLGIHERCVRMLIRLNMHEAEDSYFDRVISMTDGAPNSLRKPNATMFNEIHNDAEELYRSVMAVLDISNFVITDHPESISSPESLPPNFTDMVNDLTDTRIDIEKTIKRSRLIEGEDLSVSQYPAN